MIKKDIPFLQIIWILSKNFFQGYLIISLAVWPGAKWHIPMAMLLLGSIFAASEVNEERLELKLKALQSDWDYYKNKLKRKGAFDEES